MSVQENREAAQAFLKSLASGEIDESLLAEDAVWWIPNRGVIDRAAFLALAKAVNTRFKGPMDMRVTAVTAEDDRVAIEASGRAELKDGRVYENTYHFLFYLRDGRIRESREHNNSLIPATLFAPARA
jgi:ketosteroid isomerase-like protein